MSLMLLESIKLFGLKLEIRTRTCSDKVYSNLCGLNVPDDGTECESFKIISIDSLLVNENNYYLQI